LDQTRDRWSDGTSADTAHPNLRSLGHMAEKKPKRINTAQLGQSAHNAEAPLPENVRRLIRGKVIDLSGASNFFKKRAEAASSLQGFVEPLHNFHYRLTNRFDSFYFVNLHHFYGSNSLEVPDALAEGLYQLGRHWAKIDCGNLPIASIPSDDFLRSEWQGADDWGAFLLRDACIGEVWWHSLGGDGKIRNWNGRSDPGDFELRIDFGPETTKPPVVTISVKGEPAAILMRWWMTLTPNSAPQKFPGIEALREKAGNMLDSLAGQLKTNLKLTKPKKGRPRDDFGEQAAYLRDHKKQNMALIAKELCKLPPHASATERRKCFDRIRKAANNYYKLLRSDYNKLTTIRVRERIIRIPGNPNAVKSE
jgi:hypothetical protein